jgi:membrane-associated protein
VSGADAFSNVAGRGLQTADQFYMELFQQIWNALRTGSLPDLGAWSYVILFLLVFVEGPAVTLVAGALAASGLLQWQIVFVVAATGNFLADSFWYLTGYFGGNRRFLYRFRWIRQRRSLIRSLEANMRDQGVKLFLMTKLSLGILTIPVLIAAGLARVRWYRLILVSLVVEPIWNGLLVFAGYRLGDYLSQMERGLRILALTGSVIVLLIIIAMYRRVFMRIIQTGKPS